MALQNPKAFQNGIWQLVSWTNYGGPAEPLKVGDVLYIKPVVLSFDVPVWKNEARSSE